MGKPKSIAETSLETWASLTPEQITKTQGRVIKAIENNGNKGAICEEIEMVTGLKHQTASATLRRLELDGKVYRPGMKRKTSSGRPAFVYFAGKPPVQGELW